MLGLPPSYSLYETVKYEGVTSRINSYQPASPQSNYQAGQLITFNLPMEFLDLRNHSFQFTVAASAPGSTYAYFNSDIRSIISRITIAFGSKVVYDCQNQNVLFNILNNIKDVNWKNTSGLVLNQTGDVLQRGADFTNPNRVYAVQLYDLHSQLLALPLPLQKLNMQMIINIYLAKADNCITTDSLTPTYTVNNCQFHIASLIPSPGWEMLYKEKIPKGISFNYLNFENTFDSSVLNAGVTRASKTLNFRYSSLLSLIAVMRPSANLNSLTAQDKLNRFDFNNLNGLQVRIGSYVQPTDSEANPADRLTMLCETMGMSTQFPLQAALNWTSTSFIMAVNLSKHPFEEPTQNNSINGLNTSISSAIILDMSFAAPLSQNYTLDVFAVSECSVIFQANGGIIWEN